MTGDLDLDGLRHVATGVAYRMVGSRTEAEDLAQEALVRVAAAAEHEELRSPEAYVTTVATRLAIDHLRLARVQREEYLGPWLPEPIAVHWGADLQPDGARAQRSALAPPALIIAGALLLSLIGASGAYVGGRAGRLVIVTFGSGLAAASHRAGAPW